MVYNNVSLFFQVGLGVLRAHERVPAGVDVGILELSRMYSQEKLELNPTRSGAAHQCLTLRMAWYGHSHKMDAQANWNGCRKQGFASP
jgi:hypothetical protein